MLFRQILPIVSTLSTLSRAWVCYPPPHLLPTDMDCLNLIMALDRLRYKPEENRMKVWSRHLSSTSHTEMLPRWYHIVDPSKPPSTCAILVDAAANDDVATFRLTDVVSASMVVHTYCLTQRRQVGLEFPSENGHVFAKIVRMTAGVPQLLRPGMDVAENGTRMKDWSRWKLPHGDGFLYMSGENPRGSSNASAVD